jgi:chlorophyll synthase
MTGMTAKLTPLTNPDRPFPQGRVPGNVALWFAMIWTLLAQSWALMLGPWVAAATFLGLVLAWAYSAPPLRLKAERLVGQQCRCCEL